MTYSAHGDVTWQIHFMIIIFWVEHKSTICHAESVHSKVFVVFRNKWTGDDITENMTRDNRVGTTIFDDRVWSTIVIRNSTSGDFVLQVWGEFSWNNLKLELKRRFLLWRRESYREIMHVTDDSITGKFLDQVSISPHNNIEFKLSAVIGSSITNSSAFLNSHIMIGVVVCIEGTADWNHCIRLHSNSMFGCPVGHLDCVTLSVLIRVLHLIFSLCLIFENRPKDKFSIGAVIDNSSTCVKATGERIFEHKGCGIKLVWATAFWLRHTIESKLNSVTGIASKDALINGHIESSCGASELNSFWFNRASEAISTELPAGWALAAFLEIVAKVRTTTLKLPVIESI